MARNETYLQRLDGLDLTIERATQRTPDKTRYHVYRGPELLESYRRLPDAQARFRELREASGWRPPIPQAALTPEERLQRARQAQERSAQVEHWHRVSGRRGWFKGHRV